MSAKNFCRTSSAHDWSVVLTSILIPGPDGKLPCAITGHETDAELRKLALRFTACCQASQQHARCPFRILKCLYHGSLVALINGMSRGALVSLFEMECEERNSHPIACAEANSKAATRLVYVP